MKLFFGVGIDKYLTGITPLSGAANDVRALAAWFGIMGFECITLIDEDANSAVAARLEEQVGRLGNGDMLVFFFAGHGKIADAPVRDQLLLLRDTTRSSLDIGRPSNVITVSQILAAARIPGLQLALIIDACRLPIEAELAGNRDTTETVKFEGEAIFRDFAMGPERSLALDDNTLPITILNSCSEGERAIEVKKEKRGLFSMAMESLFKDHIHLGKPIVLDQVFETQLVGTMDRIAAQHSYPKGVQKPFREGQTLSLYDLSDRRQGELETLKAQFDEQFARHAFDTPDAPWNDNCRDTLSRLSAKGLPNDELQQLQNHLHTAIDERNKAHKEAAWSQHLASFEQQLAAGQLDGPVGNNCRDTLLLLQAQSLPSDRLAPLGQHLQEAIDRRQLEADRAQDERLIALARQHGATYLGKSYAQNYLNTARRHEHDDEAHAIVAAAETAAHDNAPRTRDDKRRQQAEAEGSVDAWGLCRREAETPGLREIADRILAELHQKETEAAQKRDEEHDAGLLRKAQASPSVANWQRCLFQARTETLRKQAQEEIERLEKSNESKRLAEEQRDQSRLQRAIESNTYQAWEECWSNAETPAVRKTAKSRMAALKAKHAADKSHDARLLANAEKSDTAEAWEEVLNKASEDEIRLRAGQEIARIKQAKIDAVQTQEREQRDQARLQKAIKANTLQAWKECRDSAETAKLKETANGKIAAMEVQRIADEAHDAKLVAEAERFDTADAWENVFRKAKQNEVRDRARQEVSRIVANNRAALPRDEKRATAKPDKAAPLAYWRKLLAEMETGWGKNLANEAIETLVANDQAAWKKAGAENTVAAYQGYLDTQPEGKWRFEARTRIAGLKAATDTPKEGASPPTKRGSMANYAVSGFALLVLGAFFVYPTISSKSTSVTSTYGTTPSDSKPDVPTDKEHDKALLSIQAWEENAKTIQSSRWWTATPDGTAGQMSDNEKSWVTQTIKYAASAKPLPLSQLMLASLQCRGIAAPQVALDPQACGKTLAAALTNPKLPAGKAGDKLEDGIGILFDKWVPTSGEKVNRAFAQAIAPGLEARKDQYPNLALRLALLQTCYLQPADRSAAIKTLNGIKATAQGKAAATAAHMLDDLNTAKALPSWCRS